MKNINCSSYKRNKNHTLIKSSSFPFFTFELEVTKLTENNETNGCTSPFNRSCYTPLKTKMASNNYSIHPTDLAY